MTFSLFLKKIFVCALLIAANVWLRLLLMTSSSICLYHFPPPRAPPYFHLPFSSFFLILVLVPRSLFLASLPISVHPWLIPPLPSLGHFRIVLCLFFKARLRAKLFIWKWVLSACEWKLIFIWKAMLQDSLWKRGTRQLGNGLLCSYSSSRLLVFPFTIRPPVMASLF